MCTKKSYSPKTFVLAMTTSSKPVGYECEFVDQVLEDYFCKQCKHVAREPTIASCCIEVFCKACIEAINEDKKPCPHCESSDISPLGPHKKYQPKILLLKVHCSLKALGCEWTGQLRLLDAHLDLATGDCVYVNVDCPSKCNQKVQKCDVDTHLADHCPNRDYTCPHCSFNATFSKVTEHFEVCRYYPLVCPNRCGASFERDVLEEHMKMCGLQKVQCEFSYAGCEAEFIRDQQKEHMEQNTQKHLALVAAATLRISQEQQQVFEQKLEEQQQRFKQAQEEKDTQIKALEDQQRVFEKKLIEQQKEFHKQIMENTKLFKELKESENELRIQAGLPPYFITFSNFKEKMRRKNTILSPPLYTHPGGHKFQLLVLPIENRNGICVVVKVICKSKDMSAMLLFTITLELLNQHRDQDHLTKEIECKIHTNAQILKEVMSAMVRLYPPAVYMFTSATPYAERKWLFISHTDLEWNEGKQIQYLKNDCLNVRIMKIVDNT